MATSVSHFVKTVCLRDWWLIKAENNLGENTVAVAGIESAGRQAARVFFSAPIVRRLDLFTLKTADGIFVLLKGPINKQQTCDNGFSKEVFKHFLIGFPSDWENCAEKCFEQGTGPEATSDAGFNPELNTVTKMGNGIFKLRQPFLKDSGSTDGPENFRDGAEEADIQLQDDQIIHSVERSFEDARSHAQIHNKDMHVTVCFHDKDTYINTGYHDSNVGFREEGVRYNLRNREVPHIEVIAVHSGKLKNIAGGRSFLKKTMIAADNSMQNIRDENVNVLLTPDCIGSRKLKTQRRDTHDDTPPMEANANSTPQDAGKLKASNSHHSYGGKSYQSKKRKQSRTAKSTVKDTSYRMNIARKRSLLNKTGANADVSTASPVTLENSTQSGVAAPGGNSMLNQNGRAEDKNMRQTPGHLRSERLNVDKPITREDNAPLDVFSFQDADELEASTPHHFCAGKSYESRKEKNQKSIFTRTDADSKNFHDSARSAYRTCTSNVKNKPKTAGAEQEGDAIRGSTPKIQTKRRLDYAEQTTPVLEGEKKGPNDFSQTSVLKTSRSGRLLLPTMEFWRNQLPIYDADHGISGIRDGSSVLKIRRGRKSRHSKTGPESS